MNNDHYLQLYACCKVTTGAARSLIADLQHMSYRLIPNALAQLIRTMNGKTVGTWLACGNEEEQGIIREYLQFLLDNDLAFLMEQPADLFPEMPDTWDTPFRIQQAVIDVTPETMPQMIAGIISGFDLYVPFVQVRLFNRRSQPFDPALLIDLLQVIPAKSLQLAFNLFPSFSAQQLTALCSMPNLNGIIIADAGEDRVAQMNDTGIVYISRFLSGNTCCGIVDPAYFNVSAEHFMESWQYNSCLNRKAGIDTDGTIKNCPSMAQTFGNIHHTALSAVVEDAAFRKLWHLHKEQVSVCRDCEFRHVCTDCRAFLEDPHNLYSKPLKCGYDPYTATWSVWSDHPMKQKAAAFYAGMQQAGKSTPISSGPLTF